MAGNMSVKIFAIFAFICVLQCVSAIDFIEEFVGEPIKKTIEKEKLTCSNYAQFCDQKNTEFIDPEKPETAAIAKMASQLCTVILDAILCKTPESVDDSNDIYNIVNEKVKEIS